MNIFNFEAGLFNFGTLYMLEQVILCVRVSCALEEVQQHPWPLPDKCEKRLPSCCQLKIFPDIAKRPLGDNDIASQIYFLKVILVRLYI